MSYENAAKILTVRRSADGKYELVANLGQYGRERVLLSGLTEFQSADIGAYIARVYARGQIDAKSEIRRALEITP